MSQTGTNNWHVIWWTYLERGPADRRGDWTDLQQLYGDLVMRFPDIAFSDDLPPLYLKQSGHRDHLRLSDLVRAQLRRDIVELARPEGDRIAGRTQIFAMAVQPTAVQLVLSCGREDLHQKVGRLKSRLATLLSFQQPDIAGPKTWGQGIWHAHLTAEGAVDRVAQFVRGIDIA